MKKKIIAVISGTAILIIAAGSIYGKFESSHKEGEPDVVGTFSVNRDENITVVANREDIEDREAFARKLLQMYKNDSFHSIKFSTHRGYATSVDMIIYLWKEVIELHCEKAERLIRNELCYPESVIDQDSILTKQVEIESQHNAVIVLNAFPLMLWYHFGIKLPDLLMR